MAKIDEIISVAKGENYPIEVRIAALDSLPSGQNENKSAEMLTMAKSSTYSVELRVAAIKAAGRFA